MIDLIKFEKKYEIENKSKKYSEPVTDSDICLLEQMGATVIKDERAGTVTILNKPFKRLRRRRERRTL